MRHPRPGRPVPLRHGGGVRRGAELSRPW
ncbi:hypothetical protein GL174_17195 [Sphingobium sp. CAP-1]|nr:hypothetical protein GL174_17195 [Sphingobium sp. CAP-1]